MKVVNALRLKARGARKFVVAASGAVAQVIALGVLHGTALHDAQIALSVLTALGVYLTPNADTRTAS